MGRFIFENHSKSDVLLPKPTHRGLKMVAPKQRFEGDETYLPIRELKLIEVLQEKTTPATTKLITEQPPVVTNEGVVEYVRPNKPKKLNEQSSSNSDILLTESPVGGVKIVG